MTKNDTIKASLDELRAMDQRGELQRDDAAPDGPELDESFWANAVLIEPVGRKSVHLRIDQAVFDHFVAETGGKGHIARMQAVLKAYAQARSSLA